MSDDNKKGEHPVAAVLRREAARHQDACPAKALFTEFADAIEERETASSGPAQVATEQYRNNYETIFGKKQVVGQA